MSSQDFMQALDPLPLFQEWFSEAQALEVNDANAMVLATVDSRGLPNVRIVLLKAIEGERFVFNTNMESQKGEELKANPKAALLFYWKSLRRQIRIRGITEPLGREESGRYFQDRPRGSQIGAWASQQSRPYKDREQLKEAVGHYERTFEGQEIPCPPYWGGYSLQPLEIEFWQDRPFRLHDRLLFYRKEAQGLFNRSWLYP